MLSQMDPALVVFCEKIAAQGGPAHMPDELGGLVFTPTPVVQATVTRASARLRNVQPDVNLDQSYEALKRPKKNLEAAASGIVTFGYHFCCFLFLFLSLNWDGIQGYFDKSWRDDLRASQSLICALRYYSRAEPFDL